MSLLTRNKDISLLPSWHGMSISIQKDRGGIARRMIKVLIAITIGIIWFSRNPHQHTEQRLLNRIESALRPPQVLRLPQWHREVSQKKHLTLNSTLGFEKVFVLNLPKRVDRRDMMSLMMHSTGIKGEYFPAIDAEKIRDLRLPPINLINGLRNRNFSFTQGQLGCYRSNLDIMQHIVEKKISTALIFQDDADWDVDFQRQLQLLQEPTRSLLDALKSDDQKKGFQTFYRPGKKSIAGQGHPWQDSDWDIFWLGASYEYPWPDSKTAPYVAYRDDSVTSSNFSERGGRAVFPHYNLPRPNSEKEPGFRLVQRSRQPLGMAAYAVTFEGAYKILAKAGKSITQPYDSTICSMSRPNVPEGYRAVGCVNQDTKVLPGEAELRSISVWPPLVSQFRSSDGQRDSDLHNNRPKITLQIEAPNGYALDIKDGLRERIIGELWTET